MFREYDVRGVADRDLDDELVHALGLGIGTILSGGSRLRIALGRDCRVSSERLYRALVQGLVSAGVHVIDVGVGPTPLLYFAVHHLDADGGVMITGSHNPAEDNGFKIMRGRASFFGKDIQELRRIIENEELVRTPGGKVEAIDVSDDYVQATTKDIVRPTLPLPVVVDAGNGSGGPLALRCLRAIGVEPVESLYCDMDGLFPNHHPDPTVPKNLEQLIARVAATGARVGIAYDGDADRLGAIDQNGDIVWGDKLMILFSRAVLAKNPGAAILGEVKCSQTLYDDIASHGGRPILWKTGHSLIKAKMKEEHALLAGEMSGHLFFADRYFGYDDAIYGSLRLLEILGSDPRSLGEMLADVPRTFTTPEIRVDCPDDLKFDLVKAVTRRFESGGLPVVKVDGARVSFPSGGSAPSWGLVRASNTGPVLVMRFEAGSEEELARIRKEMETAVDEERSRLVTGAA